MANKKISELTEKTAISVDDYLPLVDSEVSPVTTKRVKVGSLSPFLLSWDAIVIPSDAPAADLTTALHLKNILGARVQICNGTDDEDEIEAAFAASRSGGIVRQAAGTCLVTAAGAAIISIDKPITWEGAGIDKSIIKIAPALVRWTYFLYAGVNSDGLIIRGITFDGDTDNQLAYADDGQQRGLELHGEDTVVEDCSLDNIPTISANLNANGCEARFNRVLKGRMCINGSHITVVRNRITDNPRAGAIECYAGTEGEQYEYITIEDNYIADSASKGIEFYISATTTLRSLKYSSIRRNTIVNCTDRALFMGGATCQYNVVQGNIFVGGLQPSIHECSDNEFSGNTLIDVGLLVTDAQRMTIVKNRLFGSSDGIFAYGVTDSTIADNDGYDVADQLIRLRSESGHYSLSNRIENNHAYSSDNVFFTNGAVYVLNANADGKNTNIFRGNTLHNGAASKALNFSTSDTNGQWYDSRTEYFNDLVAPVLADTRNYTTADTTTWTVFTQPDVPRNFQFEMENNTGNTASGAATVITFTGIDAKGRVVTDTVTYSAADLLNIAQAASVTKSTSVAFSFLTSIKASVAQAAGWRFRVHRGNLVGLADDIADATHVYRVKENTAYLAVPTVDATYDTIDLPINTGDDFTVSYKVDWNRKTSD